MGIIKFPTDRTFCDHQIMCCYKLWFVPLHHFPPPNHVTMVFAPMQKLAI